MVVVVVVILVFQNRFQKHSGRRWEISSAT
jgi:hypothetical protein